MDADHAGLQGGEHLVELRQALQIFDGGVFRFVSELTATSLADDDFIGGIAYDVGVMLFAAFDLVGFERLNKRMSKAEEKAVLLCSSDQPCLLFSACSLACSSLYCRIDLAAPLSRVMGWLRPFLWNKANASSSV